MLRVLSIANGFEGFLHADGMYFSHYSVEDMIRTDTEVTREFAPWKLWAFGSDGGGEGFFLDFRTDPPSVQMVAWVSDWKEDSVRVAASYEEFLEKVCAGWKPWQG